MIPVSLNQTPDPDEHSEYYGRYVSLVPPDFLSNMMEGQIAELEAMLQGITDEQARWAYAPGKWSVKELLGHLIDCERVFTFRTLHFARRDPNPLPGFDENQYVPVGGFQERTMENLLLDLSAVRQSTITLAHSLNDESLRYRGIANNVEFTVRAVFYITVGHFHHHVSILKERYLKALP